MNTFPFFVGCGRSGTTLVRAIFDSHPDLAIPGESHFIVHLAPHRRRYERVGGFAVDAFLEDLLAHPRFRLWRLSEADVRRALTEPAPSTMAEAIRRSFALYAAAQGKSRYGDKTPGYVMHLPLLAGLFPEARFVHIIRDGRDVALSYLDVSFGPDTVEAAALRWKRFVERGRQAGLRMGPDRYREVRYEDMLEDPQGTVESLCGFLGVRFDLAMFGYTERAREVAAGSAFPEAHQRLGLPPTKGLRDWRTQMSRDDVALFEALAGDLLVELGYDREVERPTLGQRARAARSRLRVGAGRLAHGMGKRVGFSAGRR